MIIGTLFKAIAYSKAPRTTFTLAHPAKAVRFKKFQWDMRHAYAPRVTALGAAALALPIGLWLGRKRSERISRRNGEYLGWQPEHVTGRRPSEPVAHDGTEFGVA